MLLGEYQHSLDLKSRMTLPAKFRDQLGECYIITKGLHNCLFIFPLDEWQRLSEKVKALPMAKAAPIQHFLFAGAVDAEPDKQGRVVIPNHLKEYAGLEKDVTIIGCGNRAEIWNKERWNQNISQMSPEFIEKIMDDLDF